MKNTYITSLLAIAVLVSINLPLANAQRIIEDFDTVFGLFPADTNEPVSGWSGALQSSNFGPTGIFPGIDAECGFFDAHQGDPISYVAMNYNNAGVAETDTTSTWLFSPVVEFNDGDTISFWTRTVDASMFPDRLQLRISTFADSTNVGNGPDEVGVYLTTLLDINEFQEVGGYPEEWTKFEVELEGITGSGRIALRYFNPFMNVNGNYIGIDTFRYIPYLIGDVNCDGAIDLLDVQPFIAAFTGPIYVRKADPNNDGIVNLLDIEPFVDAIVANAGT